MNSLVVIFVSTLVAIVYCEVSPEDKAKFMEVRNKCLGESGATEQMITDSMSGVITDAPEFKKYLSCIGIATGVVDADGNVHKEILIKNLMVFLDDEAKVTAAVDKCLVEKGNIEDAAVESAKCIYTELH